MRTIKDLLEVMWDNQDLFSGGLCDWANNIFAESKIAYEEWRDLRDFIRDNRPSKYSSINSWLNRNNYYYWKSRDIKPRLKWIREHYNKLDKNDTPL